MSFWTKVLRPVVKVVAAVVAAYTGNFALAATLLSSGIADHQKQRASKKARAAYNDAQRDRQQMLASATNPRQDVYGTCVVSGTVLFKHSAGPKKEFLYIAVELARHEIDAIESVWIGEQEIPSTLWDGQGWVTGGPFNKGQITLATVSRTGPGTIAAPQGVYRLVSAIRTRSDGPVDVLSLVSASGTTITVSGAAHTDTVTVTYEWTQGKPMVRILPALGSPTQTAFAAWQSEIGDKWTAAHRLRGRAAVGLRLEYDQDVFGQMRDINIRAKVRGKKLYDPRTGLTVHSNNSALITADVLRTRMRVTAAQIPDAELAAEATRCDELVATDLAGGTQRRYTCNIAISTAVAPRDSLDLVTETMAGTVVWVQGRWLIQCGAWREPTITLTAADLAEGPRHIVPKAQRSSLTNAVVATYTEPALNWISNPAPEVISPFYLAQDAGLSMPTQITLEGVTDSVRAQRLAKIELERARNGGTFSARYSANAYDCVPGQTIYSQIGRYTGATPKAYTVVDRKLDLRSLEIDLTLRETAAGVWDWNGGMPTLVDLTPNTDLPNPLAVPASLAITNIESGNSTLLQLSDGTILARVRLSWIQHSSAFVTQGGYIEIEWSRVGDTTWITTPQIPGDATTALVGPIDDRSAVLIRIRAVNAAGRASAWLNTSHIVAGKSAPPTAPTALSVTESASGQRIFEVSHVQDADHAGYLVRCSQILTASFYDMPTTAAEWSGYGRTGQSAMPADGVWQFGVVAVDTTGNYSQPVYSTATLVALRALAATGGGGNQLFNADFGLGWRGWSSVSGGIAGSRGMDIAGWTISALSPIAGNTASISQGAPIGNAGAYAEEWGDPIPVTPLNWYCASAYTGAHRCRVAVFAYFYDDSGAVVGNSYGPPATCENASELSGGPALAGYKRVYGVGQAPATARTARLVLRKYDTTAGQSTSWLFACRAMFEPVQGAGAEPGPWSPGPLGYSGDLNATIGAPAGTLVGGREAVAAIQSIDAAASAAAAAASAASAGQISANAALARLQAIDSDGVLARGEKGAVILDWTELWNSRPGISDSAAAYGISSAPFLAAVGALADHLNGLSPSWADTSQDTTIIPATWRTLWDAAYQSRTALQNAIAARAKQLADAAQQTGDSAAAAAASALSQLQSIASNGILSRGEKPDVITRWNELYWSIEAQLDNAAALSITAPRAAALARRTELAALLNGLAPGWSDTSQDTPIIPATWNAAWDAAFQARAALQNAISAQVGTRVFGAGQIQLGAATQTFWSESTFNYTPTAVEGGGNAIGSSGVISVPVEAGDEFEIFMTIKDVSFISGGVDEAGMQVYINFVNPLVSSAPTHSRFRYQAIVDAAGEAKYQSDFEKSVIVDWLPAGTANIWVSLQWGVNSHYPYSENDITGNIYLRITRIRR